MLGRAPLPAAAICQRLPPAWAGPAPQQAARRQPSSELPLAGCSSRAGRVPVGSHCSSCPNPQCWKCRGLHPGD